MFAVVDILGQQFKVFEKTDIFVHRLDHKEGSTINFEKIYLFYDGKKTFIGSPLVNNITVKAKILKHLKGDKVIVFKKKRRKGYKVKNGHRQSLTQISIQSILHNVSTSKDLDKKKITKKSIKKESETKNDNLVGKRISKTKSKTKA
tara:strand:+ start:1908 stop:2348 length:441 start_codon:yes stop_codon:yes gene_type:complete